MKKNNPSYNFCKNCKYHGYVYLEDYCDYFIHDKCVRCEVIDKPSKFVIEVEAPYVYCDMCKHKYTDKKLCEECTITSPSNYEEK